MYKEILKEDVQKPINRLLEEFKTELTEIIGQTNAEVLAYSIEIPSCVYECPHNAEFLKEMKWNEVALFSVLSDGVPPRGYIVSHSLQGVEYALSFIKTLAVNAAKSGGNPKKVIEFAEPMKLSIPCFPAIPDYDGGRLLGAFDHEDGNFGYIVTGTSHLEFKAFVKKLLKAGYQRKNRNEISGNIYLMLENTDGDMVYTYYSPMARKASVIGGKNTFTPIEVAGDGNICPMQLFQGKPSAYSGGMGMGYYLRLADGSYFVIDGGLNNNGEADELFDSMSANNPRKDGKLIIRAWLITHGHNDHYNTMRQFIAERADKVTVERILFSATRACYRRNSDTPNHWDVRTGAKSFAGCKYIKPHAGQTYKLPGCEIEVLFTAEDMFNNPFYVKSLNNASAVIRIAAAGNVILFPGDIEADSADIICDSFGNYLKCDIIQIAHHGYHGASDEFYSLAAPSTVLYPVMEGREIRWDDVGHGNYHWKRLPSVKEVILSWKGARILNLPYTPGTVTLKNKD